MDQLIGYIVVSLVGLFLMNHKSFGDGCFTMHMVGVGLLTASLTKIAEIMVKGSVPKVKFV